MEVKTGYKNTETGVIPEDWDVEELVKLGVFTKGQGIKKDDVLDEGLACIRYGELYTRYNYNINEYHSFISKNIAKTSKRIKKGDILFAGSGETKEEIGKCASFISEAEVYAGGDIVIFSPKTTNSLLLGYLLNSPIVVKQKASMGQGDAVVHISAKNLGRVVIPLPPTLEEQRAIATALSETDELISSLDNFITKKRNIKKAVMQQLLSGKKRLPGFGGEWKTTTIKEVALVTTGSKDTKDKEDDGEYPFFVRSKKVEKINTYSYEGEAVLTAGDGVGTGKVFHYIKGKFDFHQRVYKISDFISYDGFFFYKYFSKYFLKEVTKYTAKSSVDSVRREMIDNMKIPLTPTKEEQKAITQILTDVDTEIKALEQKRDKYKAIKQGMMQELLTGKIRLV